MLITQIYNYCFLYLVENFVKITPPFLPAFSNAVFHSLILLAKFFMHPTFVITNCVSLVKILSLSLLLQISGVVLTELLLLVNVEQENVSGSETESSCPVATLLEKSNVIAVSIALVFSFFVI